ADLLDREGHLPIVLKPEHGLQGRGIMVATSADRSGITLLSGEFVPVATLWEALPSGRSNGWVVERWVTPDPAVAGWRPGATPTVRLVTIVEHDSVTVHAGAIKVPRGDSGVDNLARGNLVASLDLRTGTIGAATDAHGEVRLERHPDSDTAIAGTTIPLWPEYLALAERVAGLCLPRRTMGLDIAVGVGGPVILEANVYWSESLVQLPSDRGVVRGAFIRLLHESGASALLHRRRMISSQWRR
ncbi:MAG TPA: sugar-transfer associated ATP-grasp domain-containing protein, partial [Gemmatimonadales bacterium]|nr:sugar-transfer associated ATP-grasp domain-containing protein [Gemmatimonadales bacterium]